MAPDDYDKEYCSKKKANGFCKMEYLEKQMQDVESAIQFAQQQPNVDPKALILMATRSVAS